jgi:sialate O-acetylesterase
MTVEDGAIRVHFNHAANGLRRRDGHPLVWFRIAGKDRRFVPARATIEGATVVVSSPKVADPKAVRFGWHKLAEPYLENTAGLPAIPFRTDDWPKAQIVEPEAFQVQGTP